MDLLKASVSDIADAVKSGQVTAADVGRFFFERSQKYNPALNALTICDEAELERETKRIENLRETSAAVPLLGVPVIVKDNICTQGLATTCGSKMLQGYVPPYSATVVERLKAAGAMVFAKSNCDEFAMGSSNENSAYGPVKNPWDQTRVPGGSSGGSAAAVAAQFAPLALGSDTGGSIRQPASFCGLVGLKPTYGSVSRYGLVAYASSLDQVGPLARSVADAKLCYEVLRSSDPRDGTSKTAPAQRQHTSGKNMTIGIVKDLFNEGLSPETAEALDVARKDLTKLGYKFVDVSIPSIRYAIQTYYIVATAEASANLARYDGIRYGLRVEKRGDVLSDIYRNSRAQGFGAEVKRRIMLGTFVLSSGYYDAYYEKAQKVRRLLTFETMKALSQCDALFLPTTPTSAFKLGEKTSDPLTMYLSDTCAVAANLTGVPALSVPCGRSKSGLPIGMQLMAKPWHEETLFAVAGSFETTAPLQQVPL